MSRAFFQMNLNEQAEACRAMGIGLVAGGKVLVEPGGIAMSAQAAPTRTVTTSVQSRTRSAPAEMATPRPAAKSDAWPVEESTEHFLAEGIPLTDRQHQYLGDMLLRAAERLDAYTGDSPHNTDDTGATLMAAAERHSITDLED